MTKGQNVYIVSEIVYYESSGCIHNVFSTLEKARKYVETLIGKNAVFKKRDRPYSEAWEFDSYEYEIQMMELLE